jgi:hypothetical protein
VVGVFCLTYREGADGRQTIGYRLDRLLNLEVELTVIIGYYLLGAIALGIVFIGARFLFAPYAAAAGFGVRCGPTAFGTPIFP